MITKIIEIENQIKKLVIFYRSSLETKKNNKKVSINGNI